MKRSLKIPRLLQPVRIELQAFCHCTVQHDVGTGNAVGRAQHTEFKFIPSKRKRRRAVAVRRIPVKFGKNIDPQLHLCLFCTRIRRTGFDGLQDSVQFISQKDGHSRRRRFIGAKPVIVSSCCHGNAEQILIVVHCLDHSAQKQQELGIFIGRFPRRQKVDPLIRRHRPVIMLAASVYSGKRLLVEKAYQTVLCRHLLHHFHGQLVMVRCDIGGGVNGRQLMLGRSHLVMLCFRQDPQLPELLIQILHICGHPWLDHSKIMIVHFLSLGRLRSKKSPSREPQVLSLLIHFPCNKKIFLLRPHGCADIFYIVISKQTENAQGLLI